MGVPASPRISIIWWVAKEIGAIDRNFLFETSIINQMIFPQDVLKASTRWSATGLHEI